MNDLIESRGIKIDKEVLLFLKKAENEAGSIRKLAKAIGVSHVSITRWIGNVPDCQIDCIDWPNWEKVWLYLTKEEIISDTDIRWMPPSVLRESLISGKIKPKEGSDVDFDLPPMARFPVVSLAAAAEVNTSYYPLAEYADQHSDETAVFSAGRPGDFVIRVSGGSMNPWYPPGTLLLVRPHQHIRNGDRVIAVLGDGDIVFKCFVERKNSIMLLAINGDGGQNFEFKKTDYNAIRDLYKVIQSLRMEDEMDHAMHESGVQHFWKKYEEE